MSSIDRAAIGSGSGLVPLSGSLWSGPLGETFVARPTMGALVMVMRGRVEAEAGDKLYGTITRELAKAPAAAFWDLWEMTWYHSDVRVRCTAALLESLPRVPEMHAVAQSKIVLMGISVANLAVDGRIQTHTQRSTFEAALARRR